MYLRNRPGSTRITMSRALGLSKPTVTRATAKLQCAGLVSESRNRPEAGRPGQPEIAIELNADGFRFLGLSVADQCVDTTVIALDGQVIWQSVPASLAADDEGIVAQCVELAAAAMAAVGVECCDIGMFVPALFSGRDAIYEITPTHRGIPYSRILQALRRAYSSVNVVASSRGGLLYHAIQPQHAGHVLFYLGLSEGVSGHIFDRDRPFAGGFNMAGNIGGLIPETGPRPSLPDLAAWLAEPPRELTPARIDSLFSANDERLMRWIDSRACGLSVALSAVVQLINPDRLIMGGDLPASVLNVFRERLDLSCYDTPGRRPLSKPDIIISNLLGEGHRSIGAAAAPVADFAFQGI